MKTKKHLLSAFAFIALLFIAFGSSDDETSSSDELKDGIGTIRHNTASDWDQEATMRQVGEKVWKFSKNHPDAKGLVVILVDECTDSKGNKSKYESKIECNAEDIKEFSTYQDDLSFNKNCFEWGLKMALEWKPCGNSLTDQ